MITQVNKNSLFNMFGVKDFNLLESAIDSMAPSLVEYYLSSLTDDDDTYFNKRDIEESISIGDYNLYIDYSKNIYLELTSTFEDTTQSFW
ncbi:hypothetical protein AVENP_1618 [Arcobacter venerupis]|uniref:Uncharacterized protein n=1 Tax=Arcobacter venerupis TaxID=1054033 RepID=A0AAE7BBF5_9BACT|nr:hypothetical protein [Arcobacter venerupis]QKF67167.1 hypothetical protein AVENP_1618 [Arcobacter venerupis]RWS48374.1 hypothetical protein CKA56_14125 [Arcobacter venerupis]